MVFVSIYLLVLNRISMKKMGECLLKLPKKSKFGFILADAIALFLPLFLLFLDFKYQWFFLGSALSFYIATKDGINSGRFGVYRNGFIVPSAIIFYEDILSFPVFELPVEEQKQYAKNTLIVVTKKRGQQEIVFSTDEECEAVVQKLKETGMIASGS